MPSDIDIHAARSASQIYCGVKDSATGLENRYRYNRVRTKYASLCQVTEVPGKPRYTAHCNAARFSKLHSGFEFGMGIHEMPYSQVKKDIDAWKI